MSDTGAGLAMTRRGTAPKAQNSSAPLFGGPPLGQVRGDLARFTWTPAATESHQKAKTIAQTVKEGALNDVTLAIALLSCMAPELFPPEMRVCGSEVLGCLLRQGDPPYPTVAFITPRDTWAAKSYADGMWVVRTGDVYVGMTPAGARVASLQRWQQWLSWELVARARRDGRDQSAFTESNMVCVAMEPDYRIIAPGPHSPQ